MPNEQPRIKPLAAIICDDIRTEESKKEILIGIYPSDLVIHKVPSNLRLSVYVLCEANGSGTIPIEITIEGSAVSKSAVGKGKLEILEGTKKKQHIGLSFPNIPVQLNKSGELIVKLKQGDGRKNTIKILPVVNQAPVEPADLSNLGPTVPPPPSSQ